MNPAVIDVNCQLLGRLHLAGGIMLTVVWSRNLPAEPSSVRVYQDSVGHWYASFVVLAEVQPLAETGRAIGIDWGVKETATTTSDTHDLPHAQHGRKAMAKLSRYDRMMARRKPKKGQAASKGYREAKLLRVALIEMGRKHGRDVRLVHPKHTTMDCGNCGARAKHALPLSERIYTCTACGAVSPRDKNSARVMLVRAGLNPAGVEGVRPDGALLRQAA